MKTHYKIIGVDCRNLGQTEFEYSHQAACGFVRANVSRDAGKVNCKLCLKSFQMMILKNKLTKRAPEDAENKGAA